MFSNLSFLPHRNGLEMFPVKILLLSWISIKYIMLELLLFQLKNTYLFSDSLMVSFFSESSVVAFRAFVFFCGVCNSSIFIEQGLLSKVGNKTSNQLSNFQVVNFLIICLQVTVRSQSLLLITSIQGGRKVAKLANELNIQANWDTAM